MSAAVILPILNSNTNTGNNSNRNIRRSEKFFKKFQQEIELSNSRLSTSDSSHLNNSSDTILPNFKINRNKTPTPILKQTNKTTKSSSPSQIQGTMSMTNVAIHNNNNINAVSTHNIDSQQRTAHNIKLVRSTSSLSTNGLKSASSSSTTAYYRAKIQGEDVNKKSIAEKSNQKNNNQSIASSSNSQLTSSSALLFGFKMHKPKSNLSSEDLSYKKSYSNNGHKNNMNMNREVTDFQVKPVLSKSLTNKIENAKKNLIKIKNPADIKRSSLINLSNNTNNSSSSTRNKNHSLYSLNSKYTSLIRQKHLNKLQTVSTILE